MCGICGVVEREHGATKKVVRVLNELTNRGYDSWGIGYAVDGRVETIKEVGAPPKADEADIPDSRVALGHNRWATHGGVTQGNAHPHRGCTPDFVLIQNGQINNYAELKAMQQGRHKYISQTDTEVGAHAIEEELMRLKSSGVQDTDHQSILLRAFRATFPRFDGENAMVAGNHQELVARSHDKPLVVGRTKTGYILSSDTNSILGETQELYRLKNGDTVSLNGKALLYKDGSEDPMDIPFEEKDWKHESAELDKKYPYHMIQEIHESPERLLQLLKKPEQYAAAAAYLEGVQKLYGSGCGTAYHAAKAAAHILAEVAGVEMFDYTAAGMGTKQRFLNPESAILWFSQSGETADIMKQVRMAKRSGTKQMAILNQFGSTLYHEVDQHILLNAGVEVGVAATKSFTNKLGAMYLLAHKLNGTYPEGERVIERVAKEMGLILDREDEIAQLAKEYAQNDHMYVMGIDRLDPIALETALKVKEITYIHAEGFPGTELKHGVMALIEEGIPAVVYIPEDESKHTMLDSASQVRARDARVLGVGEKNYPDAYSEHFYIPTIGHGTEILMNYFGQLFSYHLAIHRGKNPDQPRNLAKTVTV